MWGTRRRRTCVGAWLAECSVEDPEPLRRLEGAASARTRCRHRGFFAPVLLMYACGLAAADVVVVLSGDGQVRRARVAVRLCRPT